MSARMRRWAAAGALVVALPLMADSCGEPTNSIDFKRVELIIDSGSRAADRAARPMDTETTEGSYLLAAKSPGTIEIEFGSHSAYTTCTLDLDGRMELPVEPIGDSHYVVRRRTAALLPGRIIDASLRCVDRTGFAIPTISYFTVRTASMGLPSLTPSSIFLGSVPVGTTSRRASFTLRNHGERLLHTTRPWSDAPSEIAFAGAACTSALIPAGGWCSVDFTVKPNVVGDFTALVWVEVFGAGAQPEPVRVSATVTGTPATLSMSPGFLDLGQVTTGSAATGEIMTTNVGSTPARIGEVTWRGSGNIAIDWSTCATALVLPGSTCHTQVRFTPSSAGLASGQVVMTGSMVGSPVSVSVSGTGVAPQAQPTPQPTYDYPYPPP